MVINLGTTRINNRIKNYCKWFRPIIYLWIDSYLSSSAFCFYLFLASLAGFDLRYPSLGIADFTITQIISFMNRDSNTVRSWLNELKNNGLIELTEDKRIRVHNYEILFQKPSSIFDPKSDDQKHQLLRFFTQLIQNKHQKSQKIHTNDNTLAYSDNTSVIYNVDSCKDNVSDCSTSRKEYELVQYPIESQEEYKADKDSYQSSNPTIEDMKFLNEITSELEEIKEV